MLQITHRPGESILVDIAEDIDPSTPVRELFDRPIEFRIVGRRGWQFQVEIEANEGLHVYRGELADADAPEILLGPGLR